MNLHQHFKKYEFKLRLEALLKSLLWGIVAGSVAGFISAIVTWFVYLDMGLPISVGVTVIVTAITTLPLYLKVFRPSIIDNARRLDRLGLDERLVTMVEYQNDNSYMAEIQREDAKAQLEKIKKQDVRIKIPSKCIIWAAITFFFCAAMCTVNALAAAGILPSAQDFIEAITPEEPDIYIAVTYDADEGGYIEGETDQLVLKGTNTVPVLAVADDGYVFVEWSDGLTDPYRYDKNIVEELEIFATFELTKEEGEGDEGEGEGDGDEEKPGDQQQGDGDPSDEPADDAESDESQESEQGKYDEANKVIDGNQYYGEIIGDYQEYLIKYLEEHRGELSAEEIAIIESYIGIV